MPADNVGQHADGIEEISTQIAASGAAVNRAGFRQSPSIVKSDAAATEPASIASRPIPPETLDSPQTTHVTQNTLLTATDLPDS